MASVESILLFILERGLGIVLQAMQEKKSLHSLLQQVLFHESLALTENMGLSSVGTYAGILPHQTR